MLKKAAQARKEGKKLPEYDEKGQLINPYIPMYISKAPCKRVEDRHSSRPLGYMQTGQEGKLDHQRTAEKHTDSSAHHVRGVIAPGEAVTKFRKGACENCGSMTHKKQDCLERPRKRGAKWTNADIGPDEFVEEAALDFEGKRDRWAGYDAEEYEQVIHEWERTEAEKQAIRTEQRENRGKTGESSSSSSSDDEDQLYTETVDMPGQKVDLKTRMTVRNLRLREDTAKYLHDLSADPALYDPKTRSMRRIVNGDGGFVAEEDAEKEGRVFAWESSLRRERVDQEEDAVADSAKRAKVDSRLLERYGSASSTATVEKVEHSEKYVEYDKK